MVLRKGLAHRQLILVLDNVEQVLDVAPDLADLVDACPGLRLILTSRAPLRVVGELVIEVGPLPVPESTKVYDTAEALAAVARNPAVTLFTERAAAHRRFRLDSSNVAAVAAICRRLGGLPLAIELAAARLAVLSPAALLDKLKVAPLEILSRGERDLPVQQRSLRATIAWSHRLLSAREQTVLRRLSVFEHTFTLADAEAVCRAPSVSATHAFNQNPLVDDVATLVEFHLVDSDDRDEDRRFSLAVAVRDFAREQLAAAGETSHIRARLTDHIAAFVATAADGLETSAEQLWLDRLDADMDEIRVALNHLSTTDPRRALTLASGLGPYWLHRGQLGEGRRRLESALSPGSLGRESDDRRVLAAAAWSARLAADQGVIGEHPAAPAMIAALDRALNAAAGDQDTVAYLRYADFLSHVMSLHDDTDRARSVTEEAIAVARRGDQSWWLAQLLQRAAVFARLREDLQAATQLADEALALARGLSAQRLVLHAGLTVAQLPASGRTTDMPDLPTLMNLAMSLRDNRLAASVSLAIATDLMLGGHPADAAAEYHRALLLADGIGYWHAVGFALMGCAALAAVTAGSSSCGRLHGAVLAQLPVLRRGMPPAYWQSYEALIAFGRGDEAQIFDRNVEAGGALSREEVVREALDLTDRLMPARPDRAEAPRASTASAVALGPGSLTSREHAVLELIAAGHTNKDIARELAISPKTVMHHSVAIYR